MPRVKEWPNLPKVLEWQIVDGRLLDRPPRKRTLTIGFDDEGRAMRASRTICFHGRELTQMCGPCDFEVPRL